MQQIRVERSGGGAATTGVLTRPESLSGGTTASIEPPLAEGGTASLLHRLVAWLAQSGARRRFVPYA